ncbi:GlxA family transcriptional regulator, partial [Sinorhizobium fredii]|uniref:GlxA family transcriptional regulator n=1 Tax=Rhizobium fredii TaxID=380 RepID=UPI003BB6FCE0
PKRAAHVQFKLIAFLTAEHRGGSRESTTAQLNQIHSTSSTAPDRITCGGGVAPLDMMHALIAERMGTHFARRVSDWYLHTAVAEPADPQRASAAERFGTRRPALLAILEKMEATIERPLDRAAMARFAGISQRHLDRLFADELGSAFRDTYRQTRLRHARRLLEQSPLSISEIAFATGFSSSGHFSRAFKEFFGLTPRACRDRLSAP